MNIKSFVALALLQQNTASVEKNMQNCNTCKKRPSTNGFSDYSLSANHRHLVYTCFCGSNPNHKLKDMYTNRHSKSDNANCRTNALTTKLPTEKHFERTEQPINYHYHSDTSSACERCQHKQCPKNSEFAKHREQQKNVSDKNIIKNPQEMQKACEQPLDLSKKGIKNQRPNIAKPKVCISNLSSANINTRNTHKRTSEPINSAKDTSKSISNKKRVAAGSTQNKRSKCLILQNERDTLHSSHRSNHLKSGDIHLSEKQGKSIQQVPSESLGSATYNFESSKMAYKSFSLSFLSFTKYRISKSSNTNDKNTVEDSTCATPPELMGRQELSDLNTQQHTNFVSECKIEWHDKSKNMCRNKWLIDQLKDYEKNKKMIFRFIDEMEVIDVDYKLIQALYLAFIAYECFEYSVKLECHILKNKLWGIHNFVNEFYFHIMWELETLNSVTINNCDDELEYKMHILNEIQQIDEILCLYDEICSVEKGSLSYNKKLGKICYEINEFRNETQTYLERFHTADRMTIFYSLVNTMTNRGFQETKTSMSMDDSTAGNDSIDSANSGNTFMRKPKKIRSLSNYTTGKISYKYYQLLGNVNLTKKSTYMYAFTTDFDSLAPFKFGLGDIKRLRSNKGNKISASITLFGGIIAISANQKVFKNAVVDVLDFIKITKTRDVRFTGKAMDERNACLQLYEQNDTTPLSINFSIRNVRRELIKCRDVILMAMGI